MKKQVKIIIGVVVVIAIAIAVASQFFPRPMGEESSGTIGKADKYRKSQMTASDILLRDDILKDTAAVAKTLVQLIEFSSYAAKTKEVIDSNWIKPLEKNCKDEQCAHIIQLLDEYSEYIGNNFLLMKNTTDLLGKCYFTGKKELTDDIGSQLLNFVSFIDQFLQRDSVLDVAIADLNQYIKVKKVNDKQRKAQLEALKGIRDRMVVDNLLIAINTGDQKKLQVTSQYSISSMDQLKLVLSASNSNAAFLSQTQSYAFLGQSLLSTVFEKNATLSNVLFSNDNFGNIASQASGSAPMGNANYTLGKQNNLDVVVLCNQDFVKNAFSAAFGNAVLSNQNLSGFLNKPLNSIIIPVTSAPTACSQFLLSTLSSAALSNTILNQSNLGFVNQVYSSHAQ